MAERRMFAKTIAKILKCRYLKDTLIDEIKDNYNIKYVIC